MPGRPEHDVFLAGTRTALANARAPEIAPLLADYALDAAALTGLDALLAAADAAVRTQTREYAEQYAATDARQTLEAEVRARFQRHRRIARLAHADGTDGATRLALSTRVADAAATFARQARTFYETLQTDAALRAPVERRTLTSAALTDALARLDAFDAALARQSSETGEAQQATAARDTTLARLRGEMRAFEEAARLALDAHPQLRERLGLLERS